MKPLKYDPIIIQECCCSYANGISAKQICEDKIIPRSTLYYWLKKYKNIDSKEDIEYAIQVQSYKKESEKLRQMFEVLKKVDCTQSSPLRTKLNEMEKLKDEYSANILCEALGVSKGTFYNHILRNKRDNSTYAKHREELKPAIRKIFEESNQIYGAKKILAILREQGFVTGRNMVSDLMAEMGLVSCRTTAKKERNHYEKLFGTPNLVKQNFTVDAPNKVWVSDFTSYKVKNIRYHICIIIDLYARKVIAHKISPRASTQLITSTFKAAFAERNPSSDLLIFHSDQGVQFTSQRFRGLLRTQGIRQSFSRKACPYDNGVIESFNSSIKTEEIHRISYRSEAEFRRRINEYITFYNTKRIHGEIGYRTPEQKEQDYQKSCSVQ